MYRIYIDNCELETRNSTEEFWTWHKLQLWSLGGFWCSITGAQKKNQFLFKALNSKLMRFSFLVQHVNLTFFTILRSVSPHLSIRTSIMLPVCSLFLASLWKRAVTPFIFQVLQTDISAILGMILLSCSNVRSCSSVRLKICDLVSDESSELDMCMLLWNLKRK